MWKIVQELVPIVLFILLITQWILPILINTPTWWLFKSSKKKVVTPTPLDAEIKATKTYVDEVKVKVEEVRNKVDENLKTAEDLKKDADNLI